MLSPETWDHSSDRSLLDLPLFFLNGVVSFVVYVMYTNKVVFLWRIARNEQKLYVFKNSKHFKLHIRPRFPKVVSANCLINWQYLLCPLQSYPCWTQNTTIFGMSQAPSTNFASFSWSTEHLAIWVFKLGQSETGLHLVNTLVNRFRFWS